ncbi:MAG: hypothetical protein DVB28_002250 [Verrucomicrobia bacterium]|nr:MAG: hypothetical protein DVB28_002250 [Verrucomicrobiota bacterium]
MGGRALWAREFVDFGDDLRGERRDFSGLKIAVPAGQGEGDFVAARIIFENGAPFFARETVNAFGDIGGDGVKAFAGTAVDQYVQQGTAFGGEQKKGPDSDDEEVEKEPG